MDKIAADSPLGMSGVAYLRQRYLQACTKPLDPKHVEFIVDAPASTLTIRSLGYSTTGEVGKYLNAHTVGYGKASLNTVLPHPIFIARSYPMSFAELAEYVLFTYGLYIGVGEFALGTSPTVPLIATSQIAITPELTGDLIELRALPSAVLWTTGSRILLRLPTVGSQISMGALFAQADAGDLARLVDFP